MSVCQQNILESYDFTFSENVLGHDDKGPFALSSKVKIQRDLKQANLALNTWLSECLSSLDFIHF